MTFPSPAELPSAEWSAAPAKRHATRTVRLFLLAPALAALLLVLCRVRVADHLLTARYPACGHIVLVSTERHGSTWFISNAERCVSANNSFGTLSEHVEIWNHGSVKNITLAAAVSLLRSNTSVKIFPDALRGSRGNVRAFLAEARAMRAPVFILRRRLEKSFASLLAARRKRSWNVDTGGVAVDRPFEPGARFRRYAKDTEAFFADAKSELRLLDIPWDEFRYEDIVNARFAFGPRAGCYIRNCNFLTTE